MQEPVKNLITFFLLVNARADIYYSYLYYIIKDSNFKV
jgi:hypothetical protein